MINSGVSPDCNDTRKCFAMGVVHGGFRVCKILTHTYTQDGQCPFCKKRKEDINVHKDGDKDGAE